MKEEIDWKKEILESGRFNNKFSRNLLENGAKNYMQSIYIGYMYARWRQIRGLDKDDPKENIGQMQSSFKDFESKRTPLTTSDAKKSGEGVHRIQIKSPI